MHTSNKVHKPFIEDGPALSLEVQKGCSHNACRFCQLYIEEKHELVPLEFIAEDLDEYAEIESNPLRVYLANGNPLSLPHERLVTILKMIREKLPTVKEVGANMRIDDVEAKTDEQLAELRALGFTHGAIGVETGYAPALAYMNKRQTPEQVVEQCARLDAAGIRYSVFYMPGIAGAGKGQEAALASAELYSRINPMRIMIMSFTPGVRARIVRDIEEGRFEVAPEVETMREVRTFVENLRCETSLNCMHDVNFMRFEGSVPKFREHILAQIDYTIENAVSNGREAGLHRVRMAARGL